MEKYISNIGAVNYSFEDYYGKSSMLIFFKGCNIRCNYCYNWRLVFGQSMMSNSDIERLLHRDLTFIDSIVLTGGEPTIYPYDYLCELISIFKDKYPHIKVKLDTNCVKHETVNKLIDNKMIDAIGIDIKADFNIDSMKKVFFDNEEVAKMVINGVVSVMERIKYNINNFDLVDFRTIVHKHFSDNTINNIKSKIESYCGRFDYETESEQYLKLYEKRLDKSGKVIYRIRRVETPKTLLLKDVVDKDGNLIENVA